MIGFMPSAPYGDVASCNLSLLVALPVYTPVVLKAGRVEPSLKPGRADDE